MGQPNKQETFSNVQPIGQQETFSNVTPIDASQPPRGFFANIFAPRQVPTRTTPIDQTPLPGSTEGPGMLEGLADYSKASAGEIGGGAKDVVSGDIAKGMHRIISGAGAGAAPVVLPFAAVAAPAATATTLALGAAGQQAGKYGSRALGATEDQSDVVGDIAGLASGYGSTKLPSGKIAQSMKVLAEPGVDAASKLPVMDKIVSASKALGKYKEVPGQLSDIWKSKPTPESGAFGPSRTMPGQVAPEIIQPEQPVPPVRRGPLLLEAQTPSTINQAVNSPSRTLSGQIAAEMTRPPTSAPASPIPPRSGLALPPAPQGAELGDLWTPRSAPAAQTGEALGTAVVQKPPSEAAPGFQRGHLGKLLNQSLGAEEPNVQPGKPIYQRPSGPPSGAISGTVSKIPEGHTAVDSSALRSYKYDPDAREFHAYGKSGDTTYVYGDASPEEAQGFIDAPSKGKAWQDMKANHPLVAKIVNGKRIAVKAPQ